ncbi:MAG: MinD/ParA family protein [Treponemataceae bacterium]|nr:MAG: MinD/ParA family protein [Treponemataceae bacterium]
MEDQAAELRAMTNHKTRIIAVTSGKGGVGKTNLSVNMAIEYANIGKRVILIDGDLGMANVNVLINVVPKFNLLHIITQQRKMSDIIIDTEFGFRFIAGANGFSRIANLSSEELDFFAKEFSTLSNADIIIIDTGAGIAKNVLQFVGAADEVIVVTTPEPTAITDAYGIIKIITTELMTKDIRLKLLVNRAHSAEEGRRIADRIVTIVGQFLNYKIEYLGFVYDDPAVNNSVVRQKPFLAANPTSKPAQCVKHIVGCIEKTETVGDSGVANFLQKFLAKKQ